MSAKTVIATVVGFLQHHITDLNAVSDALTGVVASLPIDSQDKDRLSSAIDTLKTSANNIEAFLSNTTVVSDNGEVTVKESDIVEALANFLTSDTGKAALSEAVKLAQSAEGNANNG